MEIDVRAVLLALVGLGGLGILFGAGLAVASRVFAVKTDPKFDEVLEVMPGANCGACGFVGCAAYAAAVAAGETAVDLCPPGGAALIQDLCRIMGLNEPEASDRKVVTPYCNGGCEAAPTRFKYEGIKDCHAAAALSGGDKGCSFGCLGYASCVIACPFDAITMDDQDIPVIDEEKCTGCGICVTECPKDIFSLRPISKRVHIRCRSHDRGPVVRKLCTVGCIGCQICVRTCPFDAIHMDNNLAIIDYTKCRNCGLCVPKCPTKTIHGNFAGLPKAYIEDGCTGCSVCKEVCPVDAISGEPGQDHAVDQDKCVSCEICAEKCPESVIVMK